MQKIRPSLWFDGNAEEAIAFYLSVFKNGKVLNQSQYGDEGMGTPGTLMAATFELEGQEFFAINGGPQYTFTPAISFIIDCATQQEVDHFWDKLSEGGETSQCGWLQDKFGVSWQVVPTRLGELMTDEDDEKSSRVMKAMLEMTKLDIAALERAYHGA